MPPAVFLSFTMKHKALVDVLRAQASTGGSAPVFRDYSIKEPVEGAWKTRAERLIRASTATICLVGDTTWQSEPVGWEVRKSAELGKRVLAVYLQSKDVRIPAVLSEMGVTPMQWNIDTIMEILDDERCRTG